MNGVAPEISNMGWSSAVCKKLGQQNRRLHWRVAPAPRQHNTEKMRKATLTEAIGIICTVFAGCIGANLLGSKGFLYIFVGVMGAIAFAFLLLEEGVGEVEKNDDRHSRTM